MLRTISAIGILILAVLWFPVWVQMALFVLAVILGPYRFFFVIPAIVSDALYPPQGAWHVSSHWMTLIVLGMLGIHWVVTRTLRIRTLYGLEA